MATLICYPDAGSGGTTVDGTAARSGVDETWATIRSGAGNAHSLPATSSADVVVQASTTSNQWFGIERYLATFDISALAGETVRGAALSLKGSPGSTDTAGLNLAFGVYSATPASNNNIVNADYGQTGTTPLADTFTYSQIDKSGTTYTAFTLNAIGLALITGSVVGFSVKVVNDATNVAPTWTSSLVFAIRWIAADSAGTTDDPKLTLTYGPFTAGPLNYSRFPKYRLCR